MLALLNPLSALGVLKGKNIVLLQYKQKTQFVTFCATYMKLQTGLPQNGASAWTVFLIKILGT